MSEEIEYLFYNWVFPIIFLLAGIVLVLSIVNAIANPDRAVARANVEMLASAMNDACFEDSSKNNPITIDNFVLPETEPSPVWELVGIPKMIMKINGDPHYVLYYEMFPPGEAIGWEVFHDFDSRVILNMENPSAFNYDSMKYYAKNYIENILHAKMEGSVISNVVLSDKFDPVSGETLDAFLAKNPNSKERDFETWGRWESGQPNGAKDGSGKSLRDYYAFNNYLGMSTLNKTLVKYVACGDNTLCLKTRDGVYRFPLDECKKAGVDYIQIVNDVGFFERFKLSVGGTQEKKSDFYLASPCTTTQLKIYVDDDCGGDDEFDCKNSDEIPIFEYNSGGLRQVGTHITCLDNFFSESSGVQNNVLSGKKCLRVEVHSYDGFCYTRNVKDPNNIDLRIVLSSVAYVGVLAVGGTAALAQLGIGAGGAITEEAIGSMDLGRLISLGIGTGGSVSLPVSSLMSTTGVSSLLSTTAIAASVVLPLKMYLLTLVTPVSSTTTYGDVGNSKIFTLLPTSSLQNNLDDKIQRLLYWGWPG